MAKRVCAEPGCPTLCDTTRCPTHTRTKDKARGSRQARGYDAAHDTERAQWQRILNTGQPTRCANPDCLTPAEPIDPRSWHLGHTPDRTTWRGPEHPLCNLTEAGKVSPNRTWQALRNGHSGPYSPPKTDIPPFQTRLKRT